MRTIKGNKAAIELSMTTIIVIVLSLTLLIFGFVFVRSIMCSAIGLTDTIGKKAGDEVNKLFGATSGEVVCIGESGGVVSMNPGETNIVYCGIRANQEKEYDFRITPNYVSSTIDKKLIDAWFTSENFKRTISPGDEEAKKIARLRIPEDAPEGDLVFNVDVLVGGFKKYTKTLDYQVTRKGIIRSAIC